MTCRGCGSTAPTVVLDLGEVPPADHFPPATQPASPDECSDALAMAVCAECGLAQLVDDDTVTDEPRGIEPQALRDQAAAAVADVHAAGLLDGTTVAEFGSPHGGTWLPLLADHGFTDVTGGAAADVVLDCFGIMHDSDQAAAFATRASATAPTGTLLLQFHSLTAIVAQGQWNALRHGHFAYYSLTSVTHLLRAAGMSVTRVWTYDLYGGTVLVAARHGDHPGDHHVADLLAREADAGVATPAFAAGLQRDADEQGTVLRQWLERCAGRGEKVYAYGAASRAVALFARSGLTRDLLAGVADASPGKQGRRMPGTDIPIISPDELVAASPDAVLLTVPDLADEVARRHPALAPVLLTEPAPPGTGHHEPVSATRQDTR